MTINKETLVSLWQECVPEDGQTIQMEKKTLVMRIEIDPIDT